MAKAALSCLPVKMGTGTARRRANHSMYRDATRAEPDSRLLPRSDRLRRVLLQATGGMTGALTPHYKAPRGKWCVMRNELN
jgi:hypothetical protein